MRPTHKLFFVTGKVPTKEQIEDGGRRFMVGLQAVKFTAQDIRDLAGKVERV